MCDLQVAMASAASASLQSRRGVYQALMDARESAFLAAHFQRQRSPSGDELARLARLCDLAPERVYKYFNNQRFTSRKRKAPAAACAAGDSPEDEQMATAVGPPHAQSEPNRTRAALRVAVDAILHGRNPTAAPELHAAPAAASAPPLQLQVTDAAVTRAAAAASAVSSAAGGAPIVAAPPLTDDELNAELSACLSVQLPSAAAAAAAVPATAAAAASAVDVAAAGVSKNRSAAPTAGRSSSSTRLERFHAWLQSRGVDPFACARRCDVLRLALLVEQYGRSSSTISFVFAGACVLQAALQQCNMPPPQSLADWQQLLAQTLDTARLCRQADSLWYHVRRGGAAFCESVPTKARDDTLTALAVVGAIAPHDKTMSELWSYFQARLFPSSIAALLDAAPLLGLSPLFSCYWLALMAGLQEPRREPRTGPGVLHGVKPLKALCAVFTRVSSWYGRLARPSATDRGPWSYDWAPPMPQLQRELSACVIVALCLDNADRLPKDDDIQQAVLRVERVQAAAGWQELQQALSHSHMLLDAALTAKHVAALATSLVAIAQHLKPPATAISAQIVLSP